MGLQNEKEYLLLIDTVLPFAKLMLDRYGEFLPFGAAITATGEIIHVGADTGEDTGESRPVLDLLIEGLRAKARSESYMAAAACVNVAAVDPRSGKKADAAQVIFEHCSGEALDVFVPYRKKMFRGYEFEKPFAGPAEPRIFSKDQPTS